MSGPSCLHPHDLIEVDLAAWSNLPALPRWACDALRQAPWVVVRRAVSDDRSHIAVGVRGALREQRFAASLPPEAFRQVLRPEDLITTTDIRDLWIHPSVSPVLRMLKGYLHEIAWGPTGSVGFHLATHAPCIRTTSDLDLILRFNTVPQHADARTLLREVREIAPQADVLLELPQGAISLSEYANSSGPIVLRTRLGPILLQPGQIRDLLTVAPSVAAA